MDFNEYQTKAHHTAVYPYLYIKTKSESAIHQSGINNMYELRWPYPSMKLSGEAGEVTEKFGKILRDQNGVIPTFEYDSERIKLIKEFNPEIKTIITRQDIIKELGDPLWYISEIGHILGVTLNEIARTNLLKLKDRAKRNVIKGSGDNR